MFILRPVLFWKNSPRQVFIQLTCQAFQNITIKFRRNKRAELSSHVYTYSISTIYVLTWVWRIQNGTPQTPPGEWSDETASRLSVSTHTLITSVAGLISTFSGLPVRGFNSLSRVGSVVETPWLTNCNYLRPPTQRKEKMPNSVHSDSGILTPENSIMTGYHGARHGLQDLKQSINQSINLTKWVLSWCHYFWDIGTVRKYSMVKPDRRMPMMMMMKKVHTKCSLIW